MRDRSVGPVAAAAAAITVALLLLGQGSRPADAQSPSPPAPGTLAQEPGRLVYLRDCAWCHGPQGEGSIYGPSLIGVGAASTDLMLSTGRMPIDEPVPFPDAQIDRAPPAYSPEVIGELVEYVGSFGPGPDIPEVDPRAGSLAEGQVLYQINCAACHSTSGIGAALTSGTVAPSVRGLSATQVAEAIRLGGAGLRTGNMPRFGEETLTAEQLNSVVRYTLYLDDPSDPGGAPLGHLGPVAEGFVALAAGVLVLILFTRWIGKRTEGGKEGG